MHKKLPQSTVKLVLPSNESYESKTGCNRTLATVLWAPLKNNSKTEKTKQEGEKQTKKTSFSGVWRHFGDRFGRRAGKQSTKKKTIKTIIIISFPFLLSLSLSLSFSSSLSLFLFIFYLFSFFSFLTFSSSSFVFFLPCFLLLL